MRNELIQVLSDVKESEYITNILLNMSNRDIFFLFNLLEYVDNDTKSRWINTYNQLVKF
jgi:hypothetical protein